MGIVTKQLDRITRNIVAPRTQSTAQTSKQTSPNRTPYNNHFTANMKFSTIFVGLAALTAINAAAIPVADNQIQTRAVEGLDVGIEAVLESVIALLKGLSPGS